MGPEIVLVLLHVCKAALIVILNPHWRLHQCWVHSSLHLIEVHRWEWHVLLLLVATLQTVHSVDGLGVLVFDARLVAGFHDVHALDRDQLDQVQPLLVGDCVVLPFGFTLTRISR